MLLIFTSSEENGKFNSKEKINYYNCTYPSSMLLIYKSASHTFVDKH